MAMQVQTEVAKVRHSAIIRASFHRVERMQNTIFDAYGVDIGSHEVACGSPRDCVSGKDRSGI